MPQNLCSCPRSPPAKYDHPAPAHGMRVRSMLCRSHYAQRALGATHNATCILRTSHGTRSTRKAHTALH
eukprot:5550688-Lingulodinium_polyedra.AAC.1